jgi:outer membrane protein, heavy metal efflux system
MKHKIRIILTIFIGCLTTILFAQTTFISEKEATDLAVKNYPLIISSLKKIEQQKALVPSYLNLPNTEVLIQAPTGDQMRASVLQMMDFPTVYAAQKKALKTQVSMAEAEKETNVNLVKFSVKSSFNNLVYSVEREQILKRYDSILSDLIEVNEIRYKVGQIAILEKINGEAKYKLIQNQLLQAQTDRKNNQFQLALYLGKPGDSTYFPNIRFAKINVPVTINFEDTVMEHNPILSLYKKQIDFSRSTLKAEQHRQLPGLMFGYFNQSNNTTPYYKLNYGVTLPIAFWSYRAKVKSAKKGLEIAQNQSNLISNKLYSDFVQALSHYKQYSQSLSYFETIGVKQSKQIIESAQKSFRSGAISYYIYLQNIDQAFQIDLGYLDALKNYNQSVINLMYIKGEL